MLENISLNTIPYQNRDYIHQLAPDSLLDELRLPEQHAIAASVLNDKGERYFIGMVLFSIMEKDTYKSVLKIRWIYVLPEYRKQSIGSKMMNRIMDIVNENGVDYIQLFMSAGAEMESVIGFFDELNLAYEIQNVAEICSTLEDIGSKNLFSHPVRMEHVVPLEYVSDIRLRALFQKLPKDSKVQQDYILTDGKSLYDCNLSCVYMNEKQEIVCAFLTRYVNQTLEPVLLTCLDNRYIGKLLLLLIYAQKEAKKRYALDCIVKIRSCSRTGWAMISRLLPDLKGQMSVQAIINCKNHFH